MQHVVHTLDSSVAAKEPVFDQFRSGTTNVGLAGHRGDLGVKEGWGGQGESNVPKPAL